MDVVKWTINKWQTAVRNLDEHWIIFFFIIAVSNEAVYFSSSRQFLRLMKAEHAPSHNNDYQTGSCLRFDCVITYFIAVLCATWIAFTALGLEKTFMKSGILSLLQKKKGDIDFWTARYVKGMNVAMQALR